MSSLSRGAAVLSDRFWVKVFRLLGRRNGQLVPHSPRLVLPLVILVIPKEVVKGQIASLNAEGFCFISVKLGYLRTSDAGAERVSCATFVVLYSTVRLRRVRRQ